MQMLLSFFYFNFSFKAAEKEEHLHGFLNSADETNRAQSLYKFRYKSKCKSDIKIRNANNISKMQNLVYAFKTIIIFPSNDCWKILVFQYIQHRERALILK